MNGQFAPTSAGRLMYSFFGGWGSNVLSMPRKQPRKYAFQDYDPRINRWTGKPHEHKRESQRRVRQMSLVQI